MKEAMVRAEGAAAEITRKLEKQEKKCLKEKKMTGCICPGILKNNSRTSEKCEETGEKYEKKKKQKPQEVPQENEMKDPALSPPKPKKKKSFSKEEGVSSDLEETADSVNLPQEEEIFTQKRKQSVILKRQPTGASPREKGNSLPRRSQSAVDLKRLLAPRATLKKKKALSKTCPGKFEWTVIPWGEGHAQSGYCQPMS
ncbi:Nucleolar protein 56 [Tupaia chinensis]|uniref:Nucleolar protein 56 n=1 Tax=Tupaia chinensis TaxID=246437 RepID=L9LD66_TUPCH|nr:Nucleolar protein 56 [Tupaia chinensis]